MKIRYLMMAAACCALLATGVLLAGCQDTPSRQVPNLANYSVLLYTDSWNYRGVSGSTRDTPPTGFAGEAVENLGAVEYDIAYDTQDFDNYSKILMT